MTRMPGFGFIVIPVAFEDVRVLAALAHISKCFGYIWLALFLLTGCTADLALKKQQNPDIRQVDEKLLSSLKKVRQSELSISQQPSSQQPSSQQPSSQQPSSQQQSSQQLSSQKQSSPSQNGELLHRQLALSFQPSDQSLTKRHEKIINLFFQTLSANASLQITITVAPASGSEPFQSLQKAWQRLRSLERYVREYSDQIELIYQPELNSDSATLKVIGGRRV